MSEDLTGTQVSEPPDASVDPGGAMESALGSAELAAIELEEWFVKHIHDSAISINTALYNTVHAAKEALRGFLYNLAPKE